jgi:hypothetical protein
VDPPEAEAEAEEEGNKVGGEVDKDRGGIALPSLFDVDDNV